LLPLTASGGRQREACAILVGGRFCRSPVGRVPIHPLLHSTTDRNLGTVTNRDVESSFVMAL
jgi:hypothetical protein